MKDRFSLSQFTFANIINNNMLSRIVVIISGVVFLMLLLYLITAFSIYRYSKQKTSCEGRVAVVLGAAVWDDKPSPVLRERLNHAVDLYHSGKVGKLILTGGKSSEDKISEAEAARGYVVDKDVDEGDIVLENRSWTTYTNLVNAKSIIDLSGFGQVMIISDPLHLKRVSMMADGLGIDACVSGTPTTRYQTLSTQLLFLVRESYLYLQHYIVKI